MCLGLIACFMMSPFVYFARSNVLFMLNGERVDAQIVAPPTVVRTKFSTRYSYPVEYQDATGNQRLGVALIRDAKLKNGDVIPVRYLRSDPARSRSETGLWHSWPVLAFALVAFIILAASSCAGIAGFRDVVKHMRAGTMNVSSVSPD